MRLKRKCKRCEEMFRPTTRYNFICNSCVAKSWANVRKRREKAKKMNAKPNETKNSSLVKLQRSERAKQ